MIYLRPGVQHSGYQIITPQEPTPNLVSTFKSNCIVLVQQNLSAFWLKKSKCMDKDHSKDDVESI